MKKCYNYNPATLFFTFESDADVDPLEGENWLKPAHSCWDAPPETKIGEVARRQGGDDGQWLVVVDESTRPSPLHDWSLKKREWVENHERAKEFEETQAKEQMLAKVEAMRQGVQNWLDYEAQQAGFDNIDKAVLRAGYDGPLRKISTAYAVWMDTVWLECKDLLARWQKGDVDLETFDDVKVYLTAPPSLK